MGLLEGVNELIYVKCSEKDLAHCRSDNFAVMGRYYSIVTEINENRCKIPDSNIKTSNVLIRQSMN